MKILKVYLFLSGLILSLVGSLTAFNPVNIKASEGIEIAGNSSALNDVRSFGFLLLAFAFFSILGGLKTTLRKSANISTFLLFLSMGIGRLFSILLDGMPSDGILKATGLEIIMGITGLILFTLHNRKKSH